MEETTDDESDALLASGKNSGLAWVFDLAVQRMREQIQGLTESR